MLELIKVVLAGKKATESTSSRKNKMYQKEKMYPPQSVKINRCKNG